MAVKEKTDRIDPGIKSDEIFVDTSIAPWMAFAKAELGAKVHELSVDDTFVSSMRTALSVDSQIRATDRQLTRLSMNSPLLGAEPSSRAPEFFSRELATSANKALGRILGRMEAQQLKERNPEINKYFEGVKTDPTYDKKGRSFDIASTYESTGYGKITAWCAAFVNWCLSQAGVPHLGYATAKSWLEFGTPVAHPVYGCLAIIRPSSSTGSTTGHVAFFVRFQGNNVVLLGG
ncbi:MAG TPA: TIGR02594 family protein, partial [Nitrosospira sp.]